MAKASKQAKTGPFDWYLKSNLLVRILIGLVLGAIAGLAFGPGISWVKPFGDLFVRLLKMIVMPVVFFTLVVGAASVSPARLGKVGSKIVGYYLLTSAFAVSIGLLMANLFRPSMSLVHSSGEAVGRALNKPSLFDTLLNIIPSNPFGALSKGQVLPTIFFAVVFGIGLSYLQSSSAKRSKELASVVLDFCEGVAEIMYRIVRGVLQYAPIGVFALIAVVFGQQGAKAFGDLAQVTMTMYCAFLLHLVLVLGGFLLLFKFNPVTFFRKTREVMVTAFVTRSSSGTLPVTMKAADENLGISRPLFSFTLPMGATINMDGTAIYQGVCVLFIANSIGMPLEFSQQLTVVITAVLASIGAAGVPGAGPIMLLMVLASVGFTVEAGTPVAMAYAVILGIDALLDMGRTWVNVTGDLVGTTIIAKTEGDIDLKKW